MRVTVKIERQENYKKLKRDVAKTLRSVIIYGINETRNTAIENISRGNKSGKVYEKYNPRRSHKASAVGEYPATDTGFLVNNITTKLQPNGLEGEVVSRADYSSHLEFGTSKMGARTFMQPSLEQTRPKIRRRIKRLIK